MTFPIYGKIKVMFQTINLHYHLDSSTSSLLLIFTGAKTNTLSASDPGHLTEPAGQGARRLPKHHSGVHLHTTIENATKMGPTSTWWPWNQEIHVMINPKPTSCSSYSYIFMFLTIWGTVYQVYPQVYGKPPFWDMPKSPFNVQSTGTLTLSLP